MLHGRQKLRWWSVMRGDLANREQMKSARILVAVLKLPADFRMHLLSTACLIATLLLAGQWHGHPWIQVRNQHCEFLNRQTPSCVNL